MIFTLLLKLMNPAALLSGGAIGLAALAVLVGRSFGWPWYVTLIVVLTIVILYFVILFVVKTMQAKKAKALEQSIEQQAQAQIATSRPGREGEIEHLKSQLVEAVGALKSSKLGKGKGGEGALYVLPWYMIIGPPASGKTTLLQNGGLNFPYLDPTRSKSSVKGVGGTRNCDWWFAEEAVILDTAGRYVLPVEADDTKEWLAFLDLLKKHRGKQPINGLMVGVSISDLLAGPEESVDGHAIKIRTRIDELIKHLGVTFPVYVLFTKCDLVKGFVEFFGDFSKTERANVWGATVPRERAQKDPAQRIFEEEFDRLIEAIHEAKVPRIAQLGKPEGRAEVLFFPLQISALRNRLSRFMQILFRQNPYQELPVFRGFYLTSGTQEGRPIDQVINAMLKGFGVSASEEGMFAQASQTKSYFIEDVFAKIAFPDRHMGGPSAEGERRRRHTRVRFFGVGCVLLTLLALLLGILSSLNRSLVSRVENLSGRAKASAESAPRELPMADLRTLDDLRSNLEQMERRKGFGSKVALLGTYQGENAEAAARNLYLYVLYEKALAPALPFLENKLKDPNPNTPFVDYYDSYRAWALILDPAVRFKARKDATRTAHVLARYWSPRNGENEAEVDSLLSRQLLYASRFPQDLAALVTQRPDATIDLTARERIRAYWSAEAVYPSLVNAGVTAADITVEGAAGGQFGMTGAVTVPGAFTRDGWIKFVRPTIDWLEEMRQDWAMQEAWPGAPSLRSDLLVRYAADYQAKWVTFMEATEVESSDDPLKTKTFLERAAGDKSPVLAYLRTVDSNTQFGRDGDASLRGVEDAFVPVREFMLDPKQEKSISISRLKGMVSKDKPVYTIYQEKVAALSAAFADVAKSGDPTNSGPVQEVVGWVETTVPTDDAVGSALSGILQVPVGAVTGSVQKGKGKGIQNQWREVYRQYQQELAGRFPIEGGDGEVPIKAFEEFFGPKGAFWNFYFENLSEIITEDGAEVLDPSVPISADFKSALRQAYRIRNAFFSDSDGAGMQLSWKPGRPNKDPNAQFLVRGVRLDIGGESFVYRSGNQVFTPLAWPGKSPDAGATLAIDAGEGVKVNDLAYEGVWGLFRLVDQAKPFSEANKLSLTWRIGTDQGDVQMTYEVRSNTTTHPLERGLLRFRCPAQVAGGK